MVREQQLMFFQMQNASLRLVTSYGDIPDITLVHIMSAFKYLNHTFDL